MGSFLTSRDVQRNEGCPMRSALTLLLALATATTHVQNADEMPRQVANPIASLTSVPVQFNDEYDAGDEQRADINARSCSRSFLCPRR
jgi:hypothetical protein